MNELFFWHQKKYPLMEEVDFKKLLFQNEFAGHHMFHNKKEVMTSLNAEIKALNRSYQDLYTPIGNNYVRINIAPYLKFGFSLKYLAQIFYHSAKENNGTMEGYKQSLLDHELSIDDLENHHHSSTYRLAYDPHYRVVDKKYVTEAMRQIQLENFIDHQGSSIIAIEGKCGSGKTTMVDHLAQKITFTRIPMDDFFLRPQQKSVKRMGEVGGNIDYERILALLESIRSTSSDIIIYDKWDCIEECSRKVELKRHDRIILEGVYSFHPAFRHLIDQLAYLDIDDVTQDLRLKRRSNYLSYVNVWAVLENIYFDHEKIKLLSNIII
ncbi:MAG: hypothetical protein WCQ80_00995 [Bacilli bacterium]